MKSGCMKTALSRLKLVIGDYAYFVSQVIKKEFKLRYAQSYLGIVWVILEPLMLVITLSIVFTLIGRQGKGGVPFPIYFYSAILPWGIFSRSLTVGTNVFIADKELMRKIRYPRWIPVLSHVFVSLCDFLLAGIAFAVVLIFYRVQPTVHYLFLPLLVLLQLMLSTGIVLLLGSMNVYVRDIGKLTGLLSTIWFWFTPIVFSFPFEGRTKIIYYLNPVAGIVNNCRRIVAYGETIQLGQLVAPLILAPALMALGIYVFRKLSRNFADVL